MLRLPLVAAMLLASGPGLAATRDAPATWPAAAPAVPAGARTYFTPAAARIAAQVSVVRGGRVAGFIAAAGCVADPEQPLPAAGWIARFD